MAKARRHSARFKFKPVMESLRGEKTKSEMGRVHIQTTDSQHPWQRYPNRIKRVKATRPTQIWMADITPTFAMAGTSSTWLSFSILTPELFAAGENSKPKKG